VIRRRREPSAGVLGEREQGRQVGKRVCQREDGNSVVSSAFAEIQYSDNGNENLPGGGRERERGRERFSSTT